MARLMSWPRDESTELPPRLARRIHNAATHWDGTYRDRVRPVSDPAYYWNEDDIEMMPKSRSIAKHLA